MEEIVQSFEAINLAELSLDPTALNLFRLVLNVLQTGHIDNNNTYNLLETIETWVATWESCIASKIILMTAWNACTFAISNLCAEDPTASGSKKVYTRVFPT